MPPRLGRKTDPPSALDLMFHNETHVVVRNGGMREPTEIWTTVPENRRFMASSPGGGCRDQHWLGLYRARSRYKRESNSHPHDADMDPVYAEETELDWPQGRLSFAESLSRSSRLQWRKRRGQCWWKRCIPLVLLTGLRLAVEPICQPKYAEIDPPKLAYGGRADHVNVVGGAS